MTEDISQESTISPTRQISALQGHKKVATVEIKNQLLN